MTGTPLEQHREANADAAADLQTTREGQLLGGGVEAAEFTMIPDLETFAVLPWDKTVARFFTVTDWEFRMYAEAAP